MFTNCRSICNKISEFADARNMMNSDVIALTENWLKERLPSSFKDTNGIYHAFREDLFSLYGGVCLVFRRSSIVYLLTVPMHDKFQSLEISANDQVYDKVTSPVI